MSALEIFETAFECPYCKAFAQQSWFQGCGHFLPSNVLEAHRGALSKNAVGPNTPELNPRISHSGPVVSGVYFSQCNRCRNTAIWNGQKVIFPATNLAPHANLDMPTEVREDYDEAASILDASPRGAAALLRLALQKLCKHLGEPGKHIDTDIASLVSKGLDARVQKALDAVRVIGNEAVHPGQIDLRADRNTAEMLFRLMNLIVEKMITEPNHVQSVYDMLPENKREAIDRRDGKNTTKS